MTRTLEVEVVGTLAHAARELDLFTRVANAVRTLEDAPGISHVVASPRGEIVVIADDYTHVALRVIA